MRKALFMLMFAMLLAYAAPTHAATTGTVFFCSQEKQAAEYLSLWPTLGGEALRLVNRKSGRTVCGLVEVRFETRAAANTHRIGPFLCHIVPITVLSVRDEKTGKWEDIPPESGVIILSSSIART